MIRGTCEPGLALSGPNYFLRVRDAAWVSV